MSVDSPASVVFGTDGYEVSVKDNTLLENNGDIRGLLIAGSDGYKSHHVLTDNIGRLIITGQSNDGYTIVAGKDGYGAAVPISTLNNGVIQNRYYELATFNACATNITTAQNKSLFSIVNTSAKIIRIEEIYLINVRTANVTGVTGTFELRRILDHSGGTLISNIETYESGDLLDSGITVRTNSTVLSESSNMLWRTIFSTDEHGIAGIDVTSTQHIFQTMFPIFVKKTNNSKTITLKNNEGLNLKFIQNSNTGIFDIFCVFTQE